MKVCAVLLVLSGFGSSCTGGCAEEFSRINGVFDARVERLSFDSNVAPGFFLDRFQASGLTDIQESDAVILVNLEHEISVAKSSLQLSPIANAYALSCADPTFRNNISAVDVQLRAPDGGQIDLMVDGFYRVHFEDERRLSFIEEFSDLEFGDPLVVDINEAQLPSLSEEYQFVLIIQLNDGESVEFVVDVV